MPELELSNNELSTEEELLNLEETPTEEVEEEVAPVEEEKAEEEEQEEEKEKIKLVGEDEEDLDAEVELRAPVSVKAITAKYPNFFKDFPYVKDAYFRERDYKEVFPTVEDAKEAAQRAQQFAQFEEGLFKGDTTEVLKSLKETDQKAFATVVDNYLPALMKVDQQAYFHVLGNTISNTVISMLQEAQASGNEQLGAAAKILNQYVFGTSQLRAPRNLVNQSPQEDEARKQLDNERMKFMTDRFEMVRSDVSTRLENVLKATVAEHIDPKKSMTDYVRKNAINDVMSQLDSLLQNDAEFRRHYDGLWQQAVRSGFNQQSVAAIRKAYLSKSRTVLGKIIGKVRGEAIRGLRGGKSNTGNKQGHPPVGASLSGSRAKTKASEIPKGMKTLDYLNSED